MSAVIPANFNSPTKERWVRLCPDHGCTLRVDWRVIQICGFRNYRSDVLVCHGGDKPHDVSVWVAYDRKRDKCYGAGTSKAVHVLEGECDEAIVSLQDMKSRQKMSRFKGVVPKARPA